jgi:hypothetical protein
MERKAYPSNVTGDECALFIGVGDLVAQAFRGTDSAECIRRLVYKTLKVVQILVA